MPRTDPAERDRQDGNAPDDGGTRAPESVLRRCWAWHMHAPAERLPLGAFLATWPSAWLAHQAAISPVSIGEAAAAMTAGVAGRWALYARARRKAEAAGRDEDDLPGRRLSPREAAAVTAVAGAWFAAAAADGPGGVLGAAYLLGSAGGYLWLRQHAAVQEARARRDDEAELIRRKTWWHQIAPVIGLAGFDLQQVEETLLGEDLLLTSAPGSGLASKIAAHQDGICEQLEHLLGLPYGRTDLMLTQWPGQIRAEIRYEDPSVQGAITHPLLDPDSQFADWFPAEPSVRDPVPLLVIPETAGVVSIPLWDENGGKLIGVYAAGGQGKTTILNDLRERITAMPDAVLVQANGAKVGDELAWEPLAAATAAGSVHADEPAGTCDRILAVLDYVIALITERSRTDVVTGDSVFQPTPEDPAVILMLDEIDEILRIQGAKQRIEFIASKRRAAAVTMLVATQRAIQQWTGGGGVRANLSMVLAGNMTRASETRHATGAEYDIPDISSYSKGQPGFFQLWDPMAKQVIARGRAFNIGTIGQQQRHIIWHRDPDARPALPGPALILSDDPPDEQQASTVENGQGAQSCGRFAKARATLGGGAPQPAPAPPPQEARAPLPPPVRMIPGVPAHAAAKIRPLLERGTTAAEVGQVLGISRTTTLEYLGAFRKAGAAGTQGRGPATRWHISTRKPPVTRDYGTIEALAAAVAEGRVQVDPEAEIMLGQVRDLIAARNGGDDQ